MGWKKYSIREPTKKSKASIYDASWPLSCSRNDLSHFFYEVSTNSESIIY
jgi:hypothetical protein